MAAIAEARRPMGKRSPSIVAMIIISSPLVLQLRGFQEDAWETAVVVSAVVRCCCCCYPQIMDGVNLHGTADDGGA